MTSETNQQPSADIPAVSLLNRLLVELKQDGYQASAAVARAILGYGSAAVMPLRAILQTRPPADAAQLPDEQGSGVSAAITLLSGLGAVEVVPDILAVDQYIDQFGKATLHALRRFGERARPDLVDYLRGANWTYVDSGDIASDVPDYYTRMIAVEALSYLPREPETVTLLLALLHKTADDLKDGEFPYYIGMALLRMGAKEAREELHRIFDDEVTIPPFGPSYAIDATLDVGPMTPDGILNLFSEFRGK